VDFLINNWVLLAVAVSSGAMLMWPNLGKGGGASGVTPTEAVMLMNREKAVVVDVCEASEFAAGHVTGAKSVPLAQLEQHLPGVAKNKATPVILVCASGMRSGRAVAIARKLGYEKPYSLTGGMAAWRSANLPVQKG
jgi:rhodanese-related sulfurtransferase